MKNCINCNHQLVLDARFCNNCGTPQPENPNINESNPLIGDKNVISTSGGDITGTKITGGNVSYTNVHHAQDDTKKRVRCFYTGQGVALEDLMNCPSCKKDVARSYFNLSNKRCYHCDDAAKEQYTQLMRGYLSDGRLDSSEIKELQMHQGRLFLTDEETSTIEKLERERLILFKTSNISDKELRDIEDLAKLFEINKHIKQGDAIINVLYKKYQELPEVSFYYFLNEVDKKDSKLYDLALSSREDNLFAYYFGGIAAELEGKTDQSQKIIEKLSLVYDEYFYLNDALKLLSLAEKFDYQPNKLISEKVKNLLNEIENSSIKGIYLSAYLGLIAYVDNYCCNSANAALIAKHSDATSAALGYFLINIREQKLLAEKRKLEAIQQEELEKTERQKRKLEEESKKLEKERLEKLENKNHELKLAQEKANIEAFKIKHETEKLKKQESKERNKQIIYGLSNFWNGVPKWVKGVVWIIIVGLMVRGCSYITKTGIYGEEKEKEILTQSIGKHSELEKIESKIILGLEKGETKETLLDLVDQLIHDDTENYLKGQTNGIIDKNNPDGTFFGTYNGYWNSKRDVYKILIAQEMSVKEYLKNNNSQVLPEIDEESSNPEGREEIDDEYLYDINYYYNGNYQGAFGDEQIILNISNVTKDGEVVGFNILGDNKRALSGTFDDNMFELAEPGDDTWDGVFKFIINIENEEAIGTWISNNGKIKRSFVLKKVKNN